MHDWLEDSGPHCYLPANDTRANCSFAAALPAMMAQTKMMFEVLFACSHSQTPHSAVSPPRIHPCKKSSTISAPSHEQPESASCCNLVPGRRALVAFPGATRYGLGLSRGQAAAARAAVQHVAARSRLSARYETQGLVGGERGKQCAPKRRRVRDHPGFI